MLGLGRTRAQTRSSRSMSLGGEPCSLEWFVFLVMYILFLGQLLGTIGLVLFG